MRKLVRALAATLAVAGLCAPAASAAQPAVVGGPTVSVTTAPWQVYLDIGGRLACGGSILDSRHVLTAAHCRDDAGKLPPAPPSSFTVLAGFSDVSQWVRGQTPPPGTQVVRVSSLRVHPNYIGTTLNDDVMVLTLASPLSLSGPNARAIALAASGSAVGPGAALRVTGYGQSSPARPDGKLRALGVTAISDDDCRAIQPGTSAVVLCAFAPSGSACFGDSGGALTSAAGGATRQVGIVSYVATAGCSGPSGFTDVAAPEVRAFIDGAAVIPVAPRQRAFGFIRWPAAPVQGSPVFCSPGAWDGSPSFGYTFRVDGLGVLQTGPLGIYVPKAGDIGRSITCVVTAANAGGTSTARSGTTPAIQPDSVPPRSRITSMRCSRHRCRVRAIAVDPNSAGAVTLHASARYRGRRRHTVHRRVRVRTTSPGHFTVIASKLPRRRVVLTLVAYDAAGNREHHPSRRRARLR
jgi:hypothetical protein